MSFNVAEHPRPTAFQEAAWISAAQLGDRAAFAHLVEVYWPRLYRWVFHLTRDRHTTEDLAQDAFLKAWSNLKRFQVGTNFRAWLFRIAHNAFANLKRGPVRRRAAMPDDLPGTAPGPEQVAIGREALADLAEAVSELPEDFRAALLLRVDEELSFKQVAAILDTTEETARWRVFKARQKLLEWMERGKS